MTFKEFLAQEENKFAQSGAVKRSGGTKLGPQGWSGRKGERATKPGSPQIKPSDPETKPELKQSSMLPGSQVSTIIPPSSMSPGTKLNYTPPASSMTPGTKLTYTPPASPMSLGIQSPNPLPSPFAMSVKYTPPTNLNWPKQS